MTNGEWQWMAVNTGLAPGVLALSELVVSRSPGSIIHAMSRHACTLLTDSLHFNEIHLQELSAYVAIPCTYHPFVRVPTFKALLFVTSLTIKWRHALKIPIIKIQYS